MNKQLHPLFREILNSAIKERGSQMPSCEKCWNDAGIRSMGNGKPKVDNYHEILSERKNNPCSPQEQAGQFWDEEKQVDIRQTPTQPREER